MIKESEILHQRGIDLMLSWRKDWNKFAYDALGARLDKEQQAIIESVQHNSRTSAASGTARGKDVTGAISALCFLYLTPKWNDRGEMIENTRVICTAPSDRQILNIIVPEIKKYVNKARGLGIDLPGRMVGHDIRTDNAQWYLTGFRADPHNHEAWSGLHAYHIFFMITEASGIEQTIYDAIEGNMQGLSKMLLLFNPNITTGYAANSQKSQRWKRFRLDSLNAPNVLQKRIVIPGQVDYEWVLDKVKLWCNQINEADFLEDEGDFFFEVDGVRGLYRPNDLFRVKVRGMFPKVDSGVLVPYEWIEAANERWRKFRAEGGKPTAPLRLGSDVAGMGRDSSCECYRFDNYVDRFDMHHSGGKADHMATTGRLVAAVRKYQHEVNGLYPQVFVDTIGEGAGVYSRLVELSEEERPVLSEDRIHSVKFSEKAENGRGMPLTDVTDQYKFVLIRDYCYWGIRDWLNPANKTGAMLPPDDELAEELTQTTWHFTSNGKVKIESKEDIKQRIGHSPDKSDSLATTFYPVPDIDGKTYSNKTTELSKMFF